MLGGRALRIRCQIPSTLSENTLIMAVGLCKFSRRSSSVPLTVPAPVTDVVFYWIAAVVNMPDREEHADRIEQSWSVKRKEVSKRRWSSEGTLKALLAQILEHVR